MMFVGGMGPATLDQALEVAVLEATDKGAHGQAALSGKWGRGGAASSL